MCSCCPMLLAMVSISCLGRVKWVWLACQTAQHVVVATASRWYACARLRPRRHHAAGLVRWGDLLGPYASTCCLLDDLRLTRAQLALEIHELRLLSIVAIAAYWAAARARHYIMPATSYDIGRASVAVHSGPLLLRLRVIGWSLFTEWG